MQIKTKHGKVYEIQHCKECKKPIHKRDYESIPRYQEKKFCSSECTKKYFKRNKTGWYGKDVFEENEKKKKENNEHKLFIKALRNILLDTSSMTEQQITKTKRVLKTYERKYRINTN